MKKYVYALLAAIFLILGISLLSTLYVYKTHKEPVCVRDITIRQSLNPNTIDHLGTPVEVFCLEWKNHI